MRQFYFTFGQQYPRERHPSYPRAHRDGWVTIVAPDYDAAREYAFKKFGPHFSMQYEKEPELEYFPKGEIEKFTL